MVLYFLHLSAGKGLRTRIQVHFYAASSTGISKSNATTFFEEC